MPNELMGFDITKLQQDLADKLRTGFMEAVPPAVWAKMVAAEIETFIKDTKEHPSPFRKLVRDKLYKICDEMLDNELKKPEYQSIFVNDHYGPGPAIQQMLRELVPELVAGLFGLLAHNIVQLVRERNSRGY